MIRLPKEKTVMFEKYCSNVPSYLKEVDLKNTEGVVVIRKRIKK